MSPAASTGDQAQIRLIAEQLVDAAYLKVKDQHAPMKGNLSTVISATSLMITVFVGAVVFGELRGKVKDNTEDIIEIKKDRGEDVKTLNQIQLDVREIKTTLRVLVPTEPKEQH